MSERQRLSYTSTDVLFVLGTLLALGSLFWIVAVAQTTLFRPPAWVDSELVTSVLDFLAVSAFIIGLCWNILDSASLDESSRTRYQDYQRTIEEVDNELRNTGAGFNEVVRDVERAALAELREFCQSASRISYRL